MKPIRVSQEMIDEYTAKGYWTDETLVGACERKARLHPDREAFVDHRRRLTWAQIEEEVNNLALNLLHLGIRRDEVLVSQIPNWNEAMELRLACEKAGILFAGAILPFRHTEMEHILRVTQAVAVVVPSKFRDFDYLGMVRELQPRVPALKHIIVGGGEARNGTISLFDMCAVPPPGRDRASLNGLTYSATETSAVGITSGTTGLPKCIEWSTAPIILMLKTFARTAGLSANDVTLAITPVVTGLGYLTPLSTALVGGKSILQERFDAESTLQIIERERVTFFLAVPSQLVLLLQHSNFSKYDLSSLKAIRVTGAPLPPDVAMEAEKRFGCVLVNLYGAADGGGFTWVSTKDPPHVRYYTTGKKYEGVEIKLVDENDRPVPDGEVGEVCARGAVCYPGPFKDPEGVIKTWGAMGKEGWFHTGDLGFWDEDGNLVLAGRRKDMIIRGGQNIYPAEIENLIMTHPRVLTAAVVGMPDPVMGEKACAFVVLRNGQGFTFDEMVSFLKGKNIASFKLPERLEVVEKFSMSGDGLKVLKRELAKGLIDNIQGHSGQGGD